MYIYTRISLSLYIYIYTYVHIFISRYDQLFILTCAHTHIYIYRYTHTKCFAIPANVLMFDYVHPFCIHFAYDRSLLSNLGSGEGLHSLSCIHFGVILEALWFHFGSMFAHVDASWSHVGLSGAILKFRPLLKLFQIEEVLKTEGKSFLFGPRGSRDWV